MRDIDFSDLSGLIEAFGDEYATVHGLHEGETEELDANLVRLDEAVNSRGLYHAFYDLVGVEKQMIDSFVDWLFEDHFTFCWDDHEVECNVTDYGLSFTRTEDFDDAQWQEFAEWVQTTIPADWKENGTVEDLYIAVGKVYGAQQATADAVERLRKAGFPRMAAVLADPYCGQELSTEDVIAGHIIGVLLSGVTPQSAIDFQLDTLDAGLLPVWTNASERRSPDEVLRIYNDVLCRLIAE